MSLPWSSSARTRSDGCKRRSTVPRRGSHSQTWPRSAPTQRIIPAWSDFLVAHGRRRVRGIGEPIWMGRSAAEVVECQLHESLLNLVFAGSEGFTLLCPYDTESLPDDVITEALRSHPCSRIDGGAHANSSYRRCPWSGGPFDQPLPAPSIAAQLVFDGLADLDRVRVFVAEHAASYGLPEARARDLVLAVHEAAANSVMHAGEYASLRIWSEAETLVCELRDRGRIDDPLVGRLRPSSNPNDGRGVWLIHQLADLAQIRSDADGTTVRIHVKTEPRSPAVDRLVVLPGVAGAVAVAQPSANKTLRRRKRRATESSSSDHRGAVSSSTSRAISRMTRSRVSIRSTELPRSRDVGVVVSNCCFRA